MRTLRITFLWDDFEDEGEDNSYDKLYEGLTYLGAYEVEEEPATRPEPPQTEPKPKKP